jgi:hypothetical protein
MWRKSCSDGIERQYRIISLGVAACKFNPNCPLDQFKTAQLMGENTLLQKYNNKGRDNIDIPCSGTMNIQGAAESVTASVDGSGNIMCDDLPSSTADVRINGSGLVVVNASQSVRPTLVDQESCSTAAIRQKLIRL